MEELMKITWSEDELVRELLDDDSPLFIVSRQETSTYSNNSSKYPSNSSFFDQLIANSVLLSETSVENGSSSLTDTNYSQEVVHPITRNSMLEKGMCKGESKYTLRIKSNGNVISDDGYKWRKYGQKSIKNSSNPRSYYKCTNPRCSAKKQVERSTDDPESLIITYEGLHLHFTYPFLGLGQSDDINPTSKKPKLSSPTNEAHTKDPEITEGMWPINVSLVQQVVTDLAQEEVGLSPQGLLEDMVPLVIRKPQVKASSSHSSSVSSSCSSPPTSPLSFSWSPSDYSSLYFNIGL